MIRSLLALTIVMMVLVAAPTADSADPPLRPLELTSAQFDYLRQLETQPEHAAVLDLHASYKSEREKSLDATRLSDDIFTVAYTGGFPATILILLIAAAPL